MITKESSVSVIQVSYLVRGVRIILYVTQLSCFRLCLIGNSHYIVSGMFRIAIKLSLKSPLRFHG